MADRTMTRLRWMTAGCLLFFFALLAVRLDLFSPALTSDFNAMDAACLLPDHDIWMNLYLKDQKIGYSRSVLTAAPDGYHLQETLFMRINMMGFVQDLDMDTSAVMRADLRLDTFEFSLSSGMFKFEAAGWVEGDDALVVRTDLSGSGEQIRIPLEQPVFLTAGILPAAVSEYRTSGKDRFVFDVFDPATLSTEPVKINIAGDEIIENMGKRIQTVKLALDFMGTSQTAWVDEGGGIIKETGILGMTLEKTTRQQALADIPGNSGEDLTRLASVAAGTRIENPRMAAFLEIGITGINTDNLQLDGGRQTFANNRLSITREETDPGVRQVPENPVELAIYLRSEPFIQSDHRDIVALVKKIVAPADPPARKARAILDWISANIEKRPVLSVPGAVSTLKNRVGDCNEHAVLTAALCRAAGIPAKIEAGLVYLDGRFYYHAWNLLYADRWISADAVFSQMPADATHIRLVSGGPQNQLDLMQVIDRISLKIIEVGY